MRYTFKYIYSLWCSLPLAIEAKQRGKDAPESATRTRNLRRTEARKEASSFLTALGLDKPTDKESGRQPLPANYRETLGIPSLPPAGVG